MTPDTPTPATERPVEQWMRAAAYGIWNRECDEAELNGPEEIVIQNMAAIIARHHAAHAPSADGRGLREAIERAFYLGHGQHAYDPKWRLKQEGVNCAIAAVLAHLATFGAAGVLSPDRVTPDGAAKGNSADAAAPIPIAEREPVFPCWLWELRGDLPAGGWWDRLVVPPNFEQGRRFTHWLPDRPVAPTARPEQPAAVEPVWCAMCGNWGDHGSGTCPELHPQPEAPDVAALAKALAKKIVTAHWPYVARDSQREAITAALLTPALSALVSERDAAVKARDEWERKFNFADNCKVHSEELRVQCEAALTAARERAAKAQHAEHHERTLREAAEKQVPAYIRDLAERFRGRMKQSADAALARIKARGTTLRAGLDPIELADYAILGAHYLTELGFEGVSGAAKLAEWTNRMVKDLGAGVRAHLEEIHAAAQRRHDAELRQGGDAVRRAGAGARRAIELPRPAPPGGALRPGARARAHALALLG